MGIDLTALKREAARQALAEVRSGMLLGLGTGSTASIFVELLGEAQRDGRLRDIRAVCTSTATEALAKGQNVELVAFEEIDRLDLAVDGADEIDDDLRLIKGRGGALLREKIVEQAANRFIVIADETKRVARLGVGAYPVEVVRFFSKRLLRILNDRGITTSYRRSGNGDVFVTDEQHHILDLQVPPPESVETLHTELMQTAGVVETGFFPTEATEAFLATAQGVVRMVRSVSGGK